MQKNAISLSTASPSTNAACIRIIRRAHGDRHGAGLGDDYLGLVGSGGNLGGSCSTHEDNDCDDGTYDGFHEIGLYLADIKTICVVQNPGG